MKRVLDYVRAWVPDLDERLAAFEGEVFDDAELLEAFREEIDRCSVMLRKGMQSGSWEDVSKAAHAIKGMGGTVGLPEISVLAQEIERAIASGDERRVRELCGAMLEWAGQWTAS